MVKTILGAGLLLSPFYSWCESFSQKKENSDIHIGDNKAMQERENRLCHLARCANAF